MFKTSEPVFTCLGCVFMGSDWVEGVSKKSGKQYGFYVHRFFVPANYTTIEISDDEQLDIPVKTTGILHVDISRRGYSNVIKLVAFEVLS